MANESGVVSVIRVAGGKVAKVGQAYPADNAHTVAVDPVTHLVYVPFCDVGGQALLRV